MRVNKKRARMVLSILSFVVIAFSLAATIGVQTYQDIVRRNSLGATLEAVEGQLGDTIGNLGLALQTSCDKTARDKSSTKIRLSKQEDDQMAFRNCVEPDPRYTAYLYRGYGSAANYRGMINEYNSKANFILVMAFIFATIISIGIGYLFVNWIPATIRKIIGGIKKSYKWITAPEK